MAETSNAKFATGRGRWIRRVLWIVLALLVLYSIAGFFVVPRVFRSVLTGQVAKAIHRPVTVGKVGFNPFRLRLDLDQLHIADREPQTPFVDLGHLRVKVSWTSLFRLAPVIGEVALERPSIHLVRTGPQQFNFSDILEKPAAAPTPATPAAPSKPFRFAVSNIQIADGEILLDDKVVGQQHSIQKLQLGVPFVANLPADVDIFVQPLLRMIVDGSPVNIEGRTKPFGTSLESIAEIKLNQIDLPRYVGYVPVPLPVKVPQGKLSAVVDVHFVNGDAGPIISLAGTVAVQELDLRDPADAPLLGLKALVVNLNDVEPLHNVIHLGAIGIDGLNAHLVLNQDGTTNLTPLMGAKPAATPVAESSAAAQPSPTATPAISAQIAAAPPTKEKSQTDFKLDSFDLGNSSVEVTDNTGAPTPATLALQDIHIGAKNVQLGSSAPAPYELDTKLSGGGSVAVKGDVDLASSKANTDVTVDSIDLPALQGFAPMLAAKLASGKLSAHATLKTDFGSQFNVHVEPANVSFDDFDLRDEAGRESEVKWNKVGATIGSVDLATHQATVTEVRTDAIHLLVKRGRHGELNLAQLVRTPAPPKSRETARERRRAPERRTREKQARRAQPKPPAAPPSPAWTYLIESVALENTEALLDDVSTGRHVKLAISPLNVHVKGVSSDQRKPLTFDLATNVNTRGKLALAGTATIEPLKAEVKINTDRLDLAALDPFISQNLNATITSALLNMKGDVGVSNARNVIRASYRGDVGIARLRMLDKLTGEDFAHWDELNFRRIDFAYGEQKPKVHVGSIALSDFYARIILNKDGKLNLNDITTNPNQAPTSLTQPKQAAAASATPAPTPAAQATSQPVPADVAIGGVTLQGGHVNYTDNFIQPNYTADLTEITGKVGEFGTATTQPADVLVQGQVNGASPLQISGSVNPLAPMAFVDITAKADAIELTGFTPYSTKYTGYPITKGTLTVDVHYLLDQQKLSAENHIFIDQLTFGDKVQNSTATNLPIRLAVSLLKNSKGQIDLKIPISGSLNDPQFKIGAVILQVFENLIVKAATSPFSLIASAFGSGNQQLDFVVFKPGYATLTPDATGSLSTLAKGLQDRPELKLNICGRVDPALDTSGLREALLDRAIKTAKLNAKGGKNDIDPDSVTLTPEEYNKYLAEVYSAGKFEKPRDFIGIAKSIPPDQMKKLIITNTKVTDADLKNLADARANAVRQFMSKQIDPSRLFVVAPKLNAEGINDPKTTTRADLMPG